ncbi:uncharacterized protein LOC118502688 [Anopheles stephensi]|uniref:uncharacterized protein LOC118502688 n=1 Tax=Anopheles stephensi TaxID=30069 RepID=UPI00165879FD|nr:uncharacterized protein LOC118502688 [Anopheles stephensi]
MQMNFGKLWKLTLVVAVCFMLLCFDPVDANPLPGKTNRMIKNSKSSKSQTDTRHSLGTGTRLGMAGVGAAGGILTAIL